MSKHGMNVRKIAFGGVLSALSLVCMFLSALFPFAEYTCPALAGILLIALVIDFGKKTAWTAYGAVSLLSLLVVPNKESALLFLLFFGCYPILKSNLEHLKSRSAEWTVKILFFNISVLAAYWAVIYIFGMTEVLDDMTLGLKYGALLLLLLGNVVFVIYDMALSRLVALYCSSLRPKLRPLLKF